MKNFREDILDPFIDEAGLRSVDYFNKKGIKQAAPAGSHGYDAADDIIYEVAKRHKRKKSLFKTFGDLYHCLLIIDVQEELGKFDENNKFKPLKKDTILSYKRKVIKLIHNTINQDHRIKKKLIETIKKEYEKACNKKRT
jgi:hypothetical protein